MGRGANGQAFAAIARRLEGEIDTALKRPPDAEPRLAGVARALAPACAAVRTALADAAQGLAKRGAFDRELFVAAIRALVEAQDKRGVAILRGALGSDTAGGLAALSAACFTTDAALSAPLAKAASNPKVPIAFAAEVARLARGETNGARLLALAPRIKESHRIDLCIEVFLPLVRGPALPVAIAPALRVLRDAERHLGRWLVLAEVAARAGDPGPLADARANSTSGPDSSRAAWSLVAWALDPCGPLPATRPTVELVARLSDRPSAHRDMSFLFRMGDARAPTAKPMLEALARPAAHADEPDAGRVFRDEVALRAGACLARSYGRADLADLVGQAASGKREELRGVATAALWDTGERPAALRSAEELSAAKSLSAQAWGALVRAAAADQDEPMLIEPTFRRLQWGWVE